MVATDGDDTVVELNAGHTVRARTDIDRLAGAPVSVMLRPERLTAIADPRDDGRSIEGTVADVVFQGATARIIVHLADDSEVIASVVTGTDLPFLHPGSTVHLVDAGQRVPAVRMATPTGATASDIDTLEALADS